jgi:PKD repeat protein
LKAFNPSSSDSFGWSVSLHNDTLVVGAPGEASIATGVNGDQLNDSGPDSGAVYIYRYGSMGWLQEAYLKPNLVDFSGGFGASISLHDATLAVGASGATVNGANGPVRGGAVYVFENRGSEWMQTDVVVATNPDVSDAFGFAVALSENFLVVGAYNEESDVVGLNGIDDNNNTSDAGGAYLFARLEKSWVHHAFLKSAKPAKFNEFGRTVAIEDNTVLVSSFLEGSAGGLNTGLVYALEAESSLVADLTVITDESGNTVNLSLNAGMDHANWHYNLYGSASGIVPGVPLAGGSVLPLNVDSYLLVTRTMPFDPQFIDFSGELKEMGSASAQLNFPLPAFPSLSGMALNHAYVAFDPHSSDVFVSNTVRLQLPAFDFSNLAPVCKIRVLSTSFNAGVPLAFTGSDSYDPDRTIVGYRWDWGDGSSTSTTGISTPIHTYSSAGEYPLALTVTDDIGTKTTCTIRLNVTMQHRLVGHADCELVESKNSAEIQLSERFSGMRSFDQRAGLAGARLVHGSVVFIKIVELVELVGGSSILIPNEFGRICERYAVRLMISDIRGALATTDRPTLDFRDQIHGALLLGDQVSVMGSAWPWGERSPAGSVPVH